MVMKKQELIEEISRIIGVESPRVSTGSTEPKEILQLINSSLSLGLDPGLAKQRLAQSIVELGGGVWDPDCESRGGTVTRLGMQRILEAVTNLAD